MNRGSSSVTGEESGWFSDIHVMGWEWNKLSGRVRELSPEKKPFQLSVVSFEVLSQELWANMGANWAICRKFFSKLGWAKNILYIFTVHTVCYPVSFVIHTVGGDFAGGEDYCITEDIWGQTRNLWLWEECFFINVAFANLAKTSWKNTFTVSEGFGWYICFFKPPELFWMSDRLFATTDMEMFLTHWE